MSLLDKASLIITPNAYKESKLYSVVPSDGSGDMTVVRATTATRVNSAGLIETVGLNIPRLDYTNASCPSILVEPLRTNVLTYSEQFDTSWVNNGATIIPNNTIAPDGNLTADRLTATGGGFGIVKFSTWTATNNVASCFAKANTSNLFKIRNASGVGGDATFNLSTQVITTTGGFTGTIEALPNGWFRCIAINNLGTTGTFSLGVTAIGESVFIWGAQLEQGSNATSYIPTVGSAVTRNQDVISKTGIADLIGQTEGAIFVDLYSPFDGTSKEISLSDGTLLNRISIGFLNQVNRFTIQVIKNNITQVSNTFVSVNQDIRNKIVLSYEQNNYKLYINGVLSLTDTLAETFTNELSILQLNRGNAQNPYFGNVNSIQLYKTALTDQECINLTTL